MKIKFLQILAILFAFQTLSAQNSGSRVQLKVTVHSLNLRAEPSSKSAVLKVLNTESGVSYQDSMTATDQIEIWNGKKELGRWLKVKSFSPELDGWVFELGVSPVEIWPFFEENTYNSALFFKQNFENYWLKTEPTDSLSFFSLNKNTILIPKKPKNTFKKDSILSLPLRNGKRKVFVDSHFEDENMFNEGHSFALSGEIKDLFIVYLNAHETDATIFINKKNGAAAIIDLAQTFMFEQKPFLNLSPKQKTVIYQISYDSGGMFGLSFLPIRNYDTFAMSILDLEIPSEFRWINETTGIGRFSAGKYLKITLKNVAKW
jgi:hypothetical protein